MPSTHQRQLRTLTETTDDQKAIWAEIHATPTAPLKITFDPKTDTK